MKLYSWNINGIRAAHRKGFSDWLADTDASIIGLQEVRASVDQVPEEIRNPDGWHTHFVAAQRKGYSGVGLYTRLEPLAIRTTIHRPEFDAEGRVQIAEFPGFLFVNVYFPNGSGTNRDLSRIPYKLAFYEHLRDLLRPASDEGKAIFVVGDFNTAAEEIDLARPKANEKTSGFRPEEREEFARWLEDGWTDTFRHFCDEPEHYTWWSQRKGVRERNVGWRIDYILASPQAMNYVRDAQIHPDVYGSDHCPISVTLDERILKG